MGCRDMDKCEAAAKEIRGKTLNPHVYACHLDLASMKSIREFAEKIKKGEETNISHAMITVASPQSNNTVQFYEYCLYFLVEEQHVDVLINNAGVMRCPAWKTEDGFDMQFGVNHLGTLLDKKTCKLRQTVVSVVLNSL